VIFIFVVVGRDGKMTMNNPISFSNCLKELLDETGVKCRKLATLLNFE
jgi:hypothetical protein